MTPTTPSPISDQAAGEPNLPVAYMHRWPGCGWELDFADEFGKLPNAHSKAIPLVFADGGKCAHEAGFKCENSTAPTTGSAPVSEGWQLTETKNLDALIIAMERVQNKGYLPDSIKEAWGEFMCNPARVAAPASPAASAPHSSIARAIAQEERACRAEDALIDLVNQIKKSNSVDDHGHDLKMNRAYLEAVKLLDAVALLAASMGGEKA